MAVKRDDDGIKTITSNRKASFNYHLEDRFEAGIALMGSEIKSIRVKGINFQDGFIEERGGELWLIGADVAPYDQAGVYGTVERMRARKLLLHKKEIAEIRGRMRERGYTCVPTRAYFKRGRVKIEIALAKGKKDYDKRDAIAKRDSDRELRQIVKERGRDRDD